jgi:hypothetical protein
MISRLSVVLPLVFVCGCVCTGTRPESSTPPVADHPPAAAAIPAAGLQQNLSYLDAVVDSVLYPEEDRFELVVTVSAARSAGAKASMVEPGARLTLTPDLAADRGGTLSAFRNAKRGDRFSGTVVRALDGRWILLAAEAR